MQRSEISISSGELLPRAFRAVRTARGLSQEDFVEVSGRTYISAIERGKKHPTVEKIDELASRLEVHPLTILALSYMESSASLATLAGLFDLVTFEINQLNLTGFWNEQAGPAASGGDVDGGFPGIPHRGSPR